MSFIQIHEPGDPTLVMLHGTGGNEREFFEFGRQLSSRMGVLSMRGKEPENGMNRWFRRLAEGVFDEPNLIARTNELAETVIEQLPETKRIAVGLSNGANIVAAALLLRPEAFSAAALLAPMVPIEPNEMPDLDGKPVLMICGERDPIVPRANAQALATMLQTSGADLELVWHPGGHGISQQMVQVVSAWIARQG